MKKRSKRYKLIEKKKTKEKLNLNKSYKKIKIKNIYPTLTSSYSLIGGQTQKRFLSP